MDLLLVSIASLFAGFVDSIVGGGGLILAPTLFAVFPATHPATLFGVNKSASIWGTGAAAVQYAQRVTMPWHALLPAVAVCFAGAMAGAWTVTVISPDFLRRALPLVLLLEQEPQPQQVPGGVSDWLVFDALDADMLRRCLRHVRERGVLEATLQRLQTCRLQVERPPRPTPLAFPLLAERLTNRMSNESLLERLQRLRTVPTSTKRLTPQSL